MNLGEKIYKLRKEKRICLKKLLQSLWEQPDKQSANGRIIKDIQKQKNCCCFQMSLRYPLTFC